jgi:hypothetical protein
LLGSPGGTSGRYMTEDITSVMALVLLAGNSVRAPAHARDPSVHKLCKGGLTTCNDRKYTR